MLWLLICLLFFIYGVSIGYKNSGTNFYLIWLCFALFTFIMYLNSKLHFLDQILLNIIYICILIGFLICLCFLKLICSQFQAKGISNLDYILVLGAQYKKSGPSKALAFRLDKAIEYLNKNPNTICIVSGGQGYNEPCTEAHGMKLYLIQHGIDSDRILEEDTSTSTIENIIFSQKMIPNNVTVGIVTNNFHLYRALKIARKQGLHAYGIAASSTWWYQPNNIFREMLGIVKDTLQHNM